MEAWKHQEELSAAAAAILANHGVVYLSMEMRTGKTRTAFLTAEKMRSSLVLFVTKKKAIDDIKEQLKYLYQGAGDAELFNTDVTNYDQVHKLEPIYDMVIIDEAHSFGAFPKPSERTKHLRVICEKARYVILLSGTPSPESLCQLYHQFWVTCKGPWTNYDNFYHWAKDYVIVEKMLVNSVPINDYSMSKDLTAKELMRTVRSKNATEDAKKFAMSEIRRVEELIEDRKSKILAAVQPLMISYTQEQAGFTNQVIDQVEYVQMPDVVKKVIRLIARNRAFSTKSGATVTAETAAKQMTKIQQACGGTIKDDAGDVHIFSKHKAEYVFNTHAGRRLVVFYKFIAERLLLEEVFGDLVCDTPESFRSDPRKDAVLLLQFQSGREGVDCSSADQIIFYSIDFSAVSYIQARARLQNKTREGDITAIWVFTLGGIEDQIYQRVSDKMDYTTVHYRRDLKKLAE